MTDLVAPSAAPTTGHANVNADAAAGLHSLPVLSQQPTSSTGRVLIVGGGPAGLVSLRNLTQDESQEPGAGGQAGLDAVLYERREQIGGVWYLDEGTLSLEKARGFPSNTWPLPSSTNTRYPSPAYPALVGNVFPRFLSFSGYPFPEPASGEQFPTLDETYRYLEDFARPLSQRIRTKREVKDVWELPYAAADASTGALPRSGGWLVHTLDHSSSPPRSLYEHFAALSFCPSFTTHPAFPDVPGLGAAIDALPHKVHHAKWYRTPEPFWQSKRVVVVGNGVSSNDIAAHIALRRKQAWGEELREGEEPVRRPVRHEAVEMFPSLPDDRILDCPHIIRVDLRHDDTNPTAEPALDVTLASGEVVRDVDHLIWGTGYQVGIYDFVRVLARVPTASDLEKLRSAGVSAGSDSSADWHLDAERLGAAPFHEAHAGLSDLYVRLTPPAKYPTAPGAKSAGADRTVVSSLPSAAAAASPSASSPGPGPELDAAYPRRVPHLHSHVLYARNPTLAFGALIVSVTPFVLCDLLSRYLRAVWQGAVRLPADFESRRSEELQRFAVLKARKEELASAATPVPHTQGAPAPTPAPPHHSPHHSPPSNLLAFHVLGKNEFDFQLALRRAVLDAKPWLRTLSGLRDEEWTQEREGARVEMYREKKRWLIRREEARKARLREAGGA